ncbi:fimbria/pilus outer membrane usher protein [Utexia brackfieldae]|uniref:fimbria/pilus outer membrane usher protein n=1 Tax=Utexia brackfieldae TaxID=3074108 RepID=UPI00370D8157
MKRTKSIILRTILLGLTGVTSVCFAETDKTYIIVNDAYRGRVLLDFYHDDQPCLTAPLLLEWGVRHVFVEKMAFTANHCVIPDELTRLNILHFYDPLAQLVTLVIPAERFSNMENGVATSRWDEGITAMFLDYRLNYAHNAGEQYQDADRKDSLFADITAGLNVGAWRLRYEPIYQQDSWGNPTWHTERAVAFRSLARWRSSLSIGDSTTASSLFDSVRYRGLSLSADDRMLPDGLRTFSPWIRGYAHSNAKVTVRQNGEVIYQTFVSPGTFILKDVYPPAPDGDIDITIQESDGTESSRKIAYSAMPNLVHPGQWKYDVTLGQYQNYFGIKEQQPLFQQLALSYGLPETTTVYAGLLNARLYHSAVIGIGKSLAQWGALSLDYSVAVADDPRIAGKDRGDVLRVRYAKAFPAQESALSLLFQYFPAGHYRTFNETVAQQNTYWWDWEDGVYVGDMDVEKKYRLEARYNQYLSDSSNFYVTLSRQAMRGGDKGETSLELGYSDSWDDVDISVYAAYTNDSYSKAQAQIGLSFSLSLGAIKLPRMKLNYDQSQVNNGANSQRIGVSGTLLDDYSLGYDISTSRDQHDGSSQDLSADYQYNAGSLRLGYSQGQGYRQHTVELSGSAVLHAHGLTLGQSLGETMAIVSVPGRPGVGVDNQYGTTTDWRGYAIVSTLTPYRVNRLSLNSADLPEENDDTQLEIDVVPTAGAIMFSHFGVDQKRP